MLSVRLLLDYLNGKLSDDISFSRLLISFLFFFPSERKWYSGNLVLASSSNRNLMEKVLPTEVPNQGTYKRNRFNRLQSQNFAIVMLLIDELVYVGVNVPVTRCRHHGTIFFSALCTLHNMFNEFQAPIQTNNNAYCNSMLKYWRIDKYVCQYEKKKKPKGFSRIKLHWICRGITNSIQTSWIIIYLFIFWSVYSKT